MRASGLDWRAPGLGLLTVAAMLLTQANIAAAEEWKSAGVAADVAPLLPLEEPVTTVEAAARVDQLLAAELHAGEKTLPKRTDDETFLRRVSLDLIGELPTPEAMTAFALDRAEGKRSAAIERLLADPLYGQNWARYWRDVMLYRRGDDRALLSSMAAVAWLTEQFNANRPWDEIARQMITSRGNIFSEGHTILIASQWGQVPETAAEVSRVFLGVQIQCAQCHDHPTDRWKREQFHELAAFFPRFAIRRSLDEGPRRTFEIVSVDRPLKRPAKAEKKGPPDREYYMPDLDDPSAKGTLITPAFFVNGQKIETGTPDQERRGTIAKWITARENPWFAKAFVNRLWGELVGEGFYEPIDDLGPDRTCSAPQTIDYLAAQFVAHDFDVKWLLATIASTETYQRESRTRRNPDQTPFVANCPQRLRADQLYNALTSALEIKEAPQRRENPRYGAPEGSRGEMIALFGYDPSDPRDEVTGAIDQALVLMNSPKLAGAIAGRNSRTMLGRLLAETDNNELVVVELYLRCLAREPSDEELTTCLRYVKQVSQQEAASGAAEARATAFEDVLWALLNSTEFLYRN